MGFAEMSLDYYNQFLRDYDKKAKEEYEKDIEIELRRLEEMDHLHLELHRILSEKKRREHNPTSIEEEEDRRNLANSFLFYLILKCIYKLSIYIKCALLIVSILWVYTKLYFAN
jgi:hypothetical protein